MVIGAATTMREALALVGSPLTLHAVDRIADCRWADGHARGARLRQRGHGHAAARARSAPPPGAPPTTTSSARSVWPRPARSTRIVTAPLNKEALAAAGVKHSGHTEILAELSNTRDYAMLLMGKELKVIHVTTHVPLRRVPDLVTRDRVLPHDPAGPAHARGSRSAARPDRGVPASNPHAGEDGLFGDEEGREIIPAIEAGARRGPRRAPAPCPPTRCSPARAAASLISSSRCITTRATSR